MIQQRDQDLYISIIMIDGSFRENLSGLDSWGQQTLEPNRYELIWVEYYSDANSAVVNKINQYNNFRLITLSQTGTYHSSYCFNAGITASKGQLIIIPDADVTVEENFLEILTQEHQQNSKLALYVHRYDEPEQHRVLEPTLNHLQAVCRLRHPNNFGACLSIRKRWLLEINGYDQHPYFGTGFHANGRDLNVRLKNLGIPIMWHPHLRLYHPWHLNTAQYSISYEVQNIIINYRELNLISKPLEGIDPSLNYQLPKTTLQKAQQLYSKLNSPSKKSTRFKQPILRLLSIAQNLLSFLVSTNRSSNHKQL